MTLRGFILILFLVGFAGLSAAAGFYFLDAREEYNRQRTIEAANRVRLEETEARLREEERVLERLRTDPAYVEKVIRRKLGYAKPDEYIFRFEE